MILLPHQIEDAEFLASSRGTKGNFSGMGSGKTLTALAAIKNVIRDMAPHRQTDPKEALYKVMKDFVEGKLEIKGRKVFRK